MTTTSFFQQYEKVAEFERYLGDPLDSARQLSFQRAVEEDEQEVYPEAACAEVENWGLHQYYVPEQYGGRFRSFEELFGLLRLLARRDVTVVVAHAKTFLGAIGIWLNGSESQKARLAQLIRRRGQVSLALTEKEHGGDLLANEVTATKVDGGYLLQGEKWLINNATRSAALALFARTDPAGGPRGFSLFFIEKRLLDPSSFIHLPKIKTLGVRGADISGIRFDHCLIPDSALVGTPGAALETSLKGFQATRTLVPAISLGAADTALRSAMRFALSRRLYGASVFEIPEARRVLVEAFIDILICDCVAISAARSLHVAADRMSLWSAGAKYFVPVRVERLIAELSAVMGARHFLRQDHDCGVFQKIRRDNSLAGLFDGSTVVNLNGIAQQLQQIWQIGRKNGRQEEAQMIDCLKRIFGLSASLPDFDSARLELINRGRDDMTQSLALLPALAEKELPSIDPRTRSDLGGLLSELRQEFLEQQQALMNLRRHSGSVFNQPVQLFELARRHCVLHAAAACWWMWLFNRESLGDFFARGEWLVLGLNRLLADLQPWRWAFFNRHERNVSEYLLELQKDGRLFSILPLNLADREED